MKKIDTKLPYDLIYGDPLCKYMQDGVRYDREGDEIIPFEAFILSASGQPYASMSVANLVFHQKKLSPEQWKIVPYKKGFAFRDESVK